MFYGILVQHFSSLAAQQPVPLGHLDSLTPQLVHLTSEVPFYAATVARTRLRQAQEQLSDALLGASEGSMWPREMRSCFVSNVPAAALHFAWLREKQFSAGLCSLVRWAALWC